MPLFRGTNDAESLAGGTAGDRFYGMAGDDTITGGGGADKAFGGDGADSISGDAGRDSLEGGQGDDTLMGGADADTIYGDAGIDLIDGGDGNDFLDAFGGQNESDRIDTISGGAGDDRIRSNGTEAIDGGDGFDTVVMFAQVDGTENGQPAVLVDFSNVDGAAPSAVGLGGLTIANVEQLDVVLLDLGSNSRLLGSRGNDWFEIGVSVDQSGKGATIRGLGGDDTIIGSSAVDSINGDSGDDEIIGGGGRDLLYGGAGDDLFVIGFDSFGGNDLDTIRDFGVGNDAFLLQFGFQDLDRDDPLVSGAAPTATSERGQFLYNTGTGRLSYDADGVGAAGPVALFNLTNKPMLTAEDFIDDSRDFFFP